MALEITTLNGVDIVAQTFNAIAAMTANVSFFSMMYIAEVIGVTMCVLKYIKTRDLRTMGVWLLSFVIINAMLLTPKVDVLINDKIQVTKVKKVDNVPVGVAAPFYLFSLGGNALSQMYDTLLAQPNDLQYTNTGLLFGQRLLDDSFHLAPASGEFNANIGHFVEQCVIPDIQLNRKYSFDDLKNSSNLFNRVFHANQSELRHVSYVSSSGSANITCKEAAEKLKTTLNNEVTSGCSNCPISRMVRDFVAGRTGGAGNLAALQNSTQSAYSYLMGMNGSAVDIFKQNMMINVMRRELSGVPASLDGSADMIAIASEQSLNKMRLAHQSSYQVANKMLPALYTVFSAFMIGIFPIIILSMFVTEFSAAIVKSYLGFLFSLMLYPVLFAIFNSFVNTLANQQLNGQGFTLSNADTMKSNLTDIAGIASWLMLSIPFISFGLIKGLGQAISSAGSYLGNALSSATTADASNIAMGNMNWGNMQMENINGFKTNLNSEYKAGMHTEQLASGGLKNTMKDGTSSYDVGLSKGNYAFDINWSKMARADAAQQIQDSNSQLESIAQRRQQTSSHLHSQLTALNNHLNHVVGADDNRSVNERRALTDTANLAASALNDWSNSNTVDKGHSYSEQGRLNTGINLNGNAGISGETSSLALKGSLKGGLNVGVNGGYDRSWTNDDFSKDADSARLSENAKVSRDTSDGLSYGKDFSRIDTSRISDSKTVGLIRDIQDSYQSLNQLSREEASVRSHQKTWSETATMTESQSSSFNAYMNQEFAEYVQGRVSREEADRLLGDASLSASDRAKLNSMVDEFRHNGMDKEVRAFYTQNYDRVDSLAGTVNVSGATAPLSSVESQYNSAASGLVGGAKNQGVIDPEEKSNKIRNEYDSGVQYIDKELENRKRSSHKDWSDIVQKSNEDIYKNSPKNKD